MIFNYDKRTGASWGGIPVIAKNIKDGFINYFSKKSFGNDILDSAFGNVKSDTKIVDIISNMSNPSQKTALTNAMGSWWSNMSQQQTQAATVADAISNIGTQSFSAASALSKLGQIGSTVFSTLGTMAITTAIISGITLLIKGLYDLATAEERAIEKGKEARQTIADINKGYNDQKDYVEKNTERYNELRKGVDVSEKSGIENVSLSTEEFDEFLSINNQLASLFPSLVSGFDSQGNAMLNLSSNADDATSSLNQLLEQERQIADFKIGEQLSDATTGFITRYKQLQKDIAKQDDVIDASNELQKTIDGRIGKSGVDISKFNLDENGTLRWDYDINDDSQRELVNKLTEIYADSASAIYKGIDYGGSDSTAGRLVLNLMEATDDSVEQLREQFKIRLSEADLSSIPNDIIEATSLKNADLREIQADWNGLIPSILSQLNLYDQYTKLGNNDVGKQLQQLIANSVSNMSFDGFSTDDWTLFGDDPRQFVRQRFLDPIIEATTSESGRFKEQTAKQLLDTLSLKDVSYKDWLQQINDLTLDLANGDYEKALNLRIALGVEYVTEDGKTVFDNADELQNLSDITGLETNDLADLKLDDLQISFNAVANGSFDFEGTTIEELQEWIDKYREAQEKAKEIAPDGTLSSIFNDENYQSAAEGYEKKLSSLTGALETIRTEGKLTAEQMRDLQEEFPDMTDFSKEAISDNAMKTLGEWIGKFKENLDTLSPEGLEQVQTYVKNLTRSFGDLDVSEQEALDALQQSLIGSTTNIRDLRKQTENSQDIINGLKQQYGDDINWQIVWELAMEDRFSDPAADIYQEYNNRKLQWDIEMTEQNVADIQKGIDARASRKGVNEAARGYIEETGEALPNMNKDYFNRLTEEYNEARREYGEDSPEAQKAKKAMNAAYEEAGKSVEAENASFEETLKNDRADVEAKKNIWIARKQAYDNLDKEDTESKEYIEMQNAQADYYQALTTEQQDIDAMDQYNLKDYNNAITRSQAEAAKAQNQIDELKNKGMRVSKEYYDVLSQSYTDQATEQENIAAYWDTVAADTKRSVNDRVAAEKAAADARAEAISLRQQVDETGRSYSTDQLTEYQNAYTDLQTKATKSQEEITKAETNHQKVSEKVYNDLIKNGNDQIKNMQDQQRTLRDLQKTVVHGSDTWRDYQSQIDSLDSSIASMKNEQVGWYESMTSIISSNAQTLASTLSSAFSEMNSETGLTIDTMNELKRQFSDLAGYDVSNIFYQSADGMKFNTEAVEALVDAEYELQTNALYDTIAQQKSIMEQYGDSTTDAAQKAVSAAEQRIGAAERELSMLQALYNQQKESLTQYQAWQNAQQTENAGAHYEGLQGYLETATKAYDQGMTGTDDFREYVRYFDEWGEDTVSAYERNIEKMKRYLTDDYQGVKNFYDDLVKNGFGTHENGIYDIDMPSVEEAAHTMGMSQEWLRDMMSRGEDYGFTNDWVSSELEGRLKIKDATQKMIDEQLRYNQAERDGAGEEILKEASDNINTYSNSIHNLSGNIDDVVAREGKISAKQIQNAVSDIESLTGMIDQVKSDQSQGLISDSYAQDQIDLINQNIKSYAQDHHIPFMLDIDGNVVIDKDTLDSQFEGWEEEIKVTPVLPTNEDIMGLELTGDTQTDSVIQGLQTALDATNGLDEEMTNLFGTIQGYSGEDLDEVVFGDKQYQDKNKELETALDGVLNKLGLGQEYGNALVGVLKEVLSLDEQTQGKTYDYGSEQYNESTGTRVTNLQGELKSESIPVDIDFDASIMKADELKSKLEELKNVQRQNMNQSFLSDEASNELNTLISSTQKQYKIQLGVEAIQGQGITLDQFLKLSQEEQKQMLVDVNMNDDEYEQFVESVEGQTIKAQIEAQIASGSTSIQELNSLTGDELQDKVVELGIDVTGLEDAQELESIISTISSESTEVNVRIADDQMATLTSGDVEVGANTDAAEKAIDAVEKRADNAEGEMTVKANTDPATSAVDSAISYINSQNPIIHVDADASSLNSTIEMVLAPTRTITVHANVTGLPGGGGGTVGVDGVNNNGFAFASGTEDDKVIPVAHNNDTLVGEEGYEIHVDRDRRSWSVIGQNGPEFRDDIEPGDIVFNHAQSVRLLKNGHTNTRGKALAGGQQQISGLSRLNPVNTMLADSGGSSTNSTNLDRWNKESSQALSGLTTAAKDATAATKANTGAKNDEKEETEKTKSALEKLKDWISEFVDWVDNRIDSLTTKIDRLGKAAENATGYLNKNAKLNQAQKTLADNRTYQNALNGKMLQTNARGEAVKATGGTNRTLLFDTARGAVKYQKQADKILNKARKDGLINKNQLNMIKRQVANGSINIKKYNENVRGVIESYEEWFKKSQDLVSSMDDLVAQYKELEQTKLDNIVEEFESLANYADSVGKTSAALLSLNDTVGHISYSNWNKGLYQNQINANRNMASYYSQEMNAYKAEMAKAAGIFGTNSNEYREAQAKFQEMNQALYEAQENAAKLTIELRKLDLKPIEYAMGRFEELGKKLAGIVSLKEARGILSGREESTRINEDDYYKQIENNNDTIVELIEKVKIQQGWLDQGFYDQNGETIRFNPESDAYRELESQIAADNEQINQLLINNENLKKSIVTLRWEAFEDLQKKLNNATSDYEHLQGLINQEGLFDDNGKGWNLTDEGVANLTLIAAKMYTAEEQIKSYREALNRVQEEYDNGNRSLQDYEETSRNHVETIQKLVDGNQNLKKSIIDTYKTQITNENNALVDLINKRKEAYDAKKA